MTDTSTLAPFFSIARTGQKKSQLRRYRVTWPCGSEWTFDRLDLEIPEFVNGQQSGVTNSYDTLAEAITDLRAAGCTVVKL